MTTRTYASPQAFKQALERRLRTSAGGGTDFARGRQLLVFDRFLTRIVAVLGDAAILKGGLVLEPGHESSQQSDDRSPTPPPRPPYSGHRPARPPSREDCRHRVRIVAGASESRSPPAACLQTVPPGKINSDVEGRRRQAELGTAPCSKPSSKGAEPESHPSVASTSDPAQAMAALSRGPAGRAPTPAAPATPRQREGASRENPWRLDDRTLLESVHDVDALACPCGGRLCFLEVVTERAVAKPILVRLGLDPDPPLVASPSAASEILDPSSRGHPADEYP